MQFIRDHRDRIRGRTKQVRGTAQLFLHDEAVHGHTGLFLEFAGKIIVAVAGMGRKILQGNIFIDMHIDIIDTALYMTGVGCAFPFFLYGIDELVIHLMQQDTDLGQIDTADDSLYIAVPKGIGSIRRQTAFDR